MRSGAPDRRISLRCRTPERFLFRLREEGACLISAKTREDSVLTLRATDEDARRILALAEKYSLAVIENVPLRFDFRRAALDFLPVAAGFFACALLLWTLAGRIWVIEARCPGGGSAKAALSALSEMGITPGCAAPDADALARELMRLCPQYAHISATARGASLLLELYEETPAPEIYDSAMERDLVSRYDAVICEITALSGKAAARPGDIVKRGQALILGMERETDELTRGVAALGSATGHIWLYAEASAPIYETRRVYTGETRVSAALCLFGWSIPLSSPDPFALCEETETRLPVGGLFLPLAIRRVSCAEYREERVLSDPEQLSSALEAQALSMALAQAPNDARMIDKWVDYSMIRENECIARACVKVLAPLATTREALAREDARRLAR